MTFPNSTALRESLELNYLFLLFIYIVAPGAYHDKNFRRSLEEAKTLIYNASDKELNLHAKEVADRLDYLITRSQAFIPTKVPSEKIAQEFGQLLNEYGDEIYSLGVSLGWLEQLIDCKPLSLRKDLPSHTRVGLAAHAGQASVEEAFLLHDSFLLLEIACLCYNSLLSASTHFPEVKSIDKDYFVLATGNQNTGSAARLCVFSFYSFVEVFVNSIGTDFAAKNEATLTDKQVEILRGKKRNRYLSLERKMEVYPTIIRRVTSKSLVITDPHQRVEPFSTFFSKIKEIRDVSTHYALGKARIWKKPEEWLQLADTTSHISVDIASLFWDECYPGRDRPDYLLGLEYEELKKMAKERIDISKKLFSFNSSPSLSVPARSQS